MTKCTKTEKCQYLRWDYDDMIHQFVRVCTLDACPDQDPDK